MPLKQAGHGLKWMLGAKFDFAGSLAELAVNVIEAIVAASVASIAKSPVAAFYPYQHLDSPYLRLRIPHLLQSCGTAALHFDVEDCEISDMMIV